MAVAVERRGRAAWLLLDEPERRNALSAAMLDELAGALGEAEADDAVRAIVLTGRGASFCAGADLRNPASPLQLAAVMQAMERCRKPVLAAVNGHAFGGGIGLVAAADIAIASAAAVLSFSEVRLGVIPAIIAVACVPKLGEHHARRLFLTGVRLSAEEARAVGLLHRVVPAGGLEAAVEAELAELALGAPGRRPRRRRSSRGSPRPAGPTPTPGPPGRARSSSPRRRRRRAAPRFSRSGSRAGPTRDGERAACPPGDRS